MGKLLEVSSAAGSQAAASSNTYNCVGLSGWAGGNRAGGTTEAHSQRKWRGTTATWSKLGVNIGANARTTTTVFKSRINTADGTQTTNIGSTATGWFFDSTHSDTLVDGDLTATDLLTGTGSGTINYAVTSSILDVGGGNNPVTMCSWTRDQSGSSDISTHTVFTGFTGTAGALWYASTEAIEQTTVRAPGVYSNLQHYLSANTKAVSYVITTRVNAADVNETLTIGAGTTGLFEDATHSDTVASGDLVCDKYVTTDSNSVTFRFQGHKFAPSSLVFDLFAGNNSATGVQSGDQYTPLAGNIVYGNTTESAAQITTQLGLTWSKLRGNVQSNGATTAFTSRINTADGTQTWTTGASGTGFFEDTTHSDTVLIGDLLDIKMNSNGGTTAIRQMASTGTQSLVTGTGTMAFAGIGFNAVGRDTTGRAVMAFSGVSFVGASTEFASAISTFFMGFSAAVSVAPDNVTRLFTLPGIADQAVLETVANEALVQTKMYDAAKWSGFSVIVNSNTTTVTNTLGFRVNGVNATQTVAYTSGVSGQIQDVTHSDYTFNGDLTDGYAALGNDAGNSFSLDAVGVAIRYATQARTIYSTYKNVGFGLNNNSATRFHQVGGAGTSYNPEAGAPFKTRSAQTLKNFNIYIQLNARITNTTYFVRTDTASPGTMANGNQTIVFGSGTTGFAEDITHTDSLNVAGQWCYSVSTLTGGGQITASKISMRSDPASNAGGVDIVSGAPSATSISSSRAQPICGRIGLNGVAATRYALNAPCFMALKNLRVYSAANAGATTVAIRKTGVEGNCSVAIADTVTGWVEDTTHIDTFTLGSTERPNYQVTVASSLTPTYFGVTQFTPNTETSTANMAFAGISFSASATDRHTGVGVMSFSGISYNASATDRHTGTGTMTFAGISYNASATDRHTGAGNMAFSGISFNSSGLVTKVKGTAVMTFGGVAFQAAGTDGHSSIGNMAFSGISYNASATARHTGTATMSFGGVAFQATGTDKHTGVGVMAFGGISFAVVGVLGAKKSKIFWFGL